MSTSNTHANGGALFADVQTDTGEYFDAAAESEKAHDNK
jgi:hypothetical protein